jgi:cytochrome c oxidase subunit 3
LGTLFLVGVVGLEWNGHLAPTDGVYGAIFFGMTGIHALHVLSGVIFIMIIWNNGRRGHYSSERHWGVEACAVYWHYVDVAWVFFYPALYLIGTVGHL